MKNAILGSIFAAVALAATGVANATVYSLTSTAPGQTLNVGDIGTVADQSLAPHSSFTDDFFFTLGSGAPAAAVAGLVFDSGSTAIDNLTATLIDLTHPGTYGGTGPTFVVPSLAALDQFKLEITGSTPGGAGQFQGFVLVAPASPVPLPAAAWLLLSGLVGVGAMSRRRSVEA